MSLATIISQSVPSEPAQQSSYTDLHPIADSCSSSSWEDKNATLAYCHIAKIVTTQDPVHSRASGRGVKAQIVVWDGARVLVFLHGSQGLLMLFFPD